MIQSLAERTALITGGTDGIGKEISRGLASRGVRVLVVGRNPDKGARAQRDLRESTGNQSVEFVQADLSLVRETDCLTTEIARRWSALDYLVHSAGVVLGRRELTSEDVESNFATRRAVAQFCQANDVFTVELRRRLAAANGDLHVTITSLKIGVVKTNIRRESWRR